MPGFEPKIRTLVRESPPTHTRPGLPSPINSNFHWRPQNPSDVDVRERQFVDDVVSAQRRRRR